MQHKAEGRIKPQLKTRYIESGKRESGEEP